MGKTRKRRQRGGVDLAKTIEKVQRMDVQIDAMTQKINGLKALLQEPMTPIPDSAFRLPAPLPSVAAVPPHLRGQTTPVPEATAPKHSPLTRQGAFRDQREVTVAPPPLPPPRPLVRQGALKEIPGVPSEGTVKTLAAQIEAKKPMPPPPVPLIRQGALRSIPGVPKPRHVAFTNRPQVRGTSLRNRNINVERTLNLMASRESGPKVRRETRILNPGESQIYARIVSQYNDLNAMIQGLNTEEVSSQIKALNAQEPNQSKKIRKQEIAKKLRVNFGDD